MSAGWDNKNGGTIIARHEYKGLSKMNGALEDWVERENLETRHAPQGLRRTTRLLQDSRRGESRHVPGAYEPDEDEEL